NALRPSGAQYKRAQHPSDLTLDDDSRTKPSSKTLRAGTDTPWSMQNGLLHSLHSAGLRHIHQSVGCAVKTRNTMASLSLGCRLDLRKIALHAPNTEYDPKRTPALVMRIREPRAVPLVFGSGKILCSGAKE
ncbi:hypothetical protein V5799_006430, partial [Amblyomma americanum]